MQTTYCFTDGSSSTNFVLLYVTGPRKTAGIPPEFIFIVESDKAFSELQNDTKIAIFYPEICSRDRYEVLQRTDDTQTS